MPRIPLIEDLTTGPIPHGSALIVEFTGVSQWYNASFSMAPRWLKQGGSVTYNSFAHPPDDVRTKLRRLGVNCEQFESKDNLSIIDWYTATLARNPRKNSHLIH